MRDQHLLWLFITFQDRYGDPCYAGVSWLARKLGVAVRTIHRYTQKLVREGFLRITRRGRKTNLYTVILRPDPERQLRREFPQGVNILCKKGYSGKRMADRNGRSNRGGPYINPSGKENKTMLEKQNPPVEEKQSQTPEPPATEAGFSPTEKQALAQEVESHRRPDGRRFACGAGLLHRLERIAAYHGFNGFQAAAELERVRRLDAHSPSRWPQKDAWFCAVLESRLKRREAKPMQREEKREIGGALFIGWTAEELARALAAEPVAQAPEAKPGADTIPSRQTAPVAAEELFDTASILAELAAAKSFPRAS